MQPGQTGLRDAGHRGGRRIGRLLGAIDVVGGEQPLELLEEGLGVEMSATEEVDRAFDDETEDDGQEERVDDEKRAALIEHVTEEVHVAPPLRATTGLVVTVWRVAVKPPAARFRFANDNLGDSVVQRSRRDPALDGVDLLSA